MIHFDFILFWLFQISLFDIWAMSQSELLYWGIMNLLTPIASVDLQKTIEDLKQKASTQISLAQFAFWYISFIVTGFWIYGFHLDAVYTIAAIALLHYAGNEDLGYFVLANLPFLHLPDSWWKNHESTKILGLKFPKSLYWLSVSKQIGPITIPSLWIPLFAGKNVEIHRFILGCLLSIGIVVGTYFIL